MRKINTIILTLLIVSAIVPPRTLVQAEPRTVIELPRWSGRDIAIHPDGKMLASASLSDVVHLVDIEAGKVVHELPALDDGITAVAYSRDGKILVGGDQEGFNILWDTETNEQIKILDKHIWVIKDMEFSPDGKILATGDWGWDNTLRFWDTQTWQFIRGMEAGKVDDISFSFDGAVVATGVLETGHVHIWNTETGEKIRTLATGMQHVLAVSFIGSERKLVCGGENGLQLWNAETGDLIRNFPKEIGDPPIHTTDINPDRRLLAAGTDNGLVQLWDMQSVELIDTLEFHRWNMFTVTFSTDGLTLASAANESPIAVWDIEPFSDPVRSVTPRNKVAALWGSIKSR